MTKSEQIQAEITNIVENNPYHTSSSNYKTPISKWMEVKLNELGILDMMPNAPFRAGYIGNSDARAVIEAAEDNGKNEAFDDYGAINTKPSKLNQLLNETETEKPIASADGTTSVKKQSRNERILDICRNNSQNKASVIASKMAGKVVLRGIGGHVPKQFVVEPMNTKPIKIQARCNKCFKLSVKCVCDQ